jgi:hypothetical protein
MNSKILLIWLHNLNNEFRASSKLSEKQSLFKMIEEPTMNSAQIRHKNFKKLFNDFINRHPDAPQRGMLKLFAQHLELSERYLSHIKCNRKNIGNAVARTIEERLKLPHGWMDREHDVLTLPSDDKEKLFVELALILFRAQPNEARDIMIELFRQRLHAPEIAAVAEMSTAE